MVIIRDKLGEISHESNQVDSETFVEEKKVMNFPKKIVVSKSSKTSFEAKIKE